MRAVALACLLAAAPGCLSVDGMYVSIATTFVGACGLRIDGTTVCWSSELFDATAPPATPFVALSGSGSHLCGLTETGAVQCWRSSAETCDLGGGDCDHLTLTGGPYVSVHAGIDSTCALDGDGRPTCAGEIETNSPSPPATPLVQVATTGELACGLSAEGMIHCWGQTGSMVPPEGPFEQIDVTWGRVCGLRPSGQVACSGEASIPNRRYTHIDLSADVLCGVTEDHTLDCTSLDDFGYRSLAEPDGTYVRAALGAVHVCGLRTDGAAVCVGEDPVYGIDGVY